MEINSTEYLIKVGYDAPFDPHKESVKILTFVDGSVELMHFGSRQEQIAEFTIIGLSNSQFVTLVDYLIAQAGNKVLIKLGQGEELFPNVTGGGGGSDEYYVYLLEPKGLQEQDFSPTRELFELKLKVALAGTTALSIPNANDSSLIDVCFKIDTIMADFEQSGIPTSTAIGERWFDTDDNNLYEADSVGADEIASGEWRLLYTVHADDADYGFVDGKFYLSLFSTISQDDPPIEQDFIGGVLTYKSVKFPRKNIDIDKGPSIARKEGFSFSFNNSALFWNYINEDSGTPIPMQGAKVTMYFFKNTAGVKTLDTIATGKIKTIDFSYTDYICKVEPFALNSDKKFPNKLIDDSEARYTDVKSDAIGKAVYRTYGEHEIAALQNVSTNREIQEVEREFPSGFEPATIKTTTSIVGQLELGDSTQLYVHKGSVSGLNIYDMDTFPLSDMAVNTYAIQVVLDSRSESDDTNSNIGKIRKITNVDNASDADYLILTLDEALPVGSTDNGGLDDEPNTDDTITFLLIKSLYRFQIDEDACKSFGSFDDVGIYKENEITLYKLDDTQRNLIVIPQTEYEDNADHNLLTLNPRVSGDSSKTVTFKPIDSDIGPIERGGIGRPLLDSGDGSTTYDFSDNFVPPNDYDDYARAAVYSLGSINQYVWTAYDTGSGSDDGKALNVYSNTWPDVDGGTSSNFRLVYKLDGGTYTKMLQANSSVIAMKFPIVHNEDESSFVNNDNMRLILKMNITSRAVNKPQDLSVSAYSDKIRYINAPFKLIVRFKRKNGNYITNNNWEHEFAENELGLYHDSQLGTQGWIQINNKPDNEDDIDGAFRTETTTLKQHFTHQITFKGNYGDPPTTLPTNYQVIKGDKAWNDDDGLLYEYDGTSWSSPGTNLAGGVIIYYRPWNWLFNSRVYKVVNGSPDTLVAATEGTDYDEEPTYNGRDLFDLTSDLFDTNGLWAELDSMEILLVNDDLENQWNNPHSTDAYFRYWEVDVFLDSETPYLAMSEEVEVIDVPLFTACRGQDLSSFKNPYWITKDILDVLYPNQYNDASLSTLTTLVTRVQWNWRRQFTSQMDDRKVLQEILTNLWACAIINADDEIEFVSMNPEDQGQGTSILTFNDSNIIVDSMSNPKFRDLNNIFSDFEIEYDYNIASEFSNSIPKYNSKSIRDRDTGSTEVRKLCEISRDIHSIINKKNFGLKYHYEAVSIEALSNWIAKWFVLNVWKIKFKISLTHLIGGNALELMDFVKVNSYFFTNSEDVEGFVTSIKPDVYNGVVDVGMHVYRPPGVFGPACDNFKNALTTDRPGSWGASNNNDAGDTTRNIGDYTIHDAGVPGRSLDC
jgi:hypothetical protein